jgi:tetratricopeptide (TPR) repeat protein
VTGRVALSHLLGLVLALSTAARGAPAADPLSSLDAAMASAEASLRDGEMQIAESRYRSALLEGWLLLAALEAADGHLPDARAALEAALRATVEDRRAATALAAVHLEMGDAAQAILVLGRLAARHPADSEPRRLLAQARVASGHSEQAVQDLEEARSKAPGDAEIAFMLATGYLRVGRAAAALPLFAELLRARPIPETHVLIGRAWRDAGDYPRARAELRAALAQDPHVRRAHYYLGMVAVLEEGVVRLEEAIAEFQQELAVSPHDALTRLRLGMALTEAQRPDEALPLLEAAARGDAPPADAFHYLGRARLALGRPIEAAAALRRALQLSAEQGSTESRLGSLHYQLGLALRRSGDPGAAAEFEMAERASAARADTSRERLADYLAGVDAALSRPASGLETEKLALPEPERGQLRARLLDTIARALVNVGVIHARALRFPRAASFFGEAARLRPGFPRVQYSLGVSLFNAGRLGEAVPPLQEALASEPGNAAVARMLAIAALQTGDDARAAGLLASDEGREADPSLQYAYGLALVRSGRAAEAQATFSRLLQSHADWPQLSVVLGHAYAAQGDYASAVAALERALSLDPRVADARAALGLIHLQEGRLPEAERALRDELEVHADNEDARQHLAAVLDLQGHADEAVPLLRAVLRARPGFADAHYLLGKILLARGDAQEAADHLQAAARLSPEDANVQFQLAQASRKLGRAEQADEAFQAYQALKAKRREVTP